MESTTLFLAQLIGPVMLAVGLGIFVSRNYYIKVYRHLENETLSVLMSGITAMVVGIVMVRYHNNWDTFLAGLVTLVGWFSILKGFFLIVTPKTVDRIGDYIATKQWFSFIAIVYMALGAYVSYAAYLA